MSQIGKPPCDDALILCGGPATPCAPASRQWVLTAAIIGSSLAFIDGTVVNVALPAIQRDLQADAFEAQWVVESYALFLAALLLVGGSLGDHFGRRMMLAIGVVLFTAASLACALSADVRQLITARAVQGVGAALLVPGSLALISASFPARERGRAIGTWSGFSGITAALGPVLGGFLVNPYSWAWAFLINVPLAIVALAITWLRVPESRGISTTGGLDFWGALLATVALGGIVYAFIEAPTQQWGSPAVLAALLVGVAAAMVFVVVELCARSPMLPLQLFRIRNFTVMNSVGPDVAGIASGVNNAVSRTAALLAIATFGIVMAWAFETGLHERLREAGVSQEISAFLDGGYRAYPACGRDRFPLSWVKAKACRPGAAIAPGSARAQHCGRVIGHALHS